ncbi:hypothetical protein ABCS02_24220 [Microbacterium sp. X-17]|uniref:hypothetical protein n=1 Tax=Microbacterium sp. X-17 TaxID=3144404 RepID=UPI0031F4CDD0
MHVAGVLPPDAPDPRVENEAQLARLGFPVMGFVPQPSVEDHGSVGLQQATDRLGISRCVVSVTYTLWRNPADKSDPMNLAELDETTRRALDEPPPWPRPPWLVEQAERSRYPFLWEAVRTAWHRDASDATTLPSQLAQHANYVLMNRFREEVGLSPGTGEGGRARWVREAHVNAAASLEVDGVRLAAAEVDTDPFVYAVGVELRADLVATVVIPREDLPLVDVSLATRVR